MPEVIANTTPLQYLHQLGLLHLLPTFYGGIIIPDTVAAEIEVGLTRGVDVPVVSDCRWIQVRAAPVLPGPLPADLHRGEIAVLSLASLSQDCLLLLDDSAARRYAIGMGLTFTGTLGILVRAFRMGQFEDLSVILDRLEFLGFRIAPSTRADCLRIAADM